VIRARAISPSTRAAAVAIAATLAWASAPALAAAPLSLVDCLERGMASSRVVAIEAAKTAAADARLSYMKSQYLPSLVGSGSGTHSGLVEGGTITAQPAAGPPITITLPDSVQDAVLFRLGLQQPLFTGFRVEAGIGQARAALAGAAADAKARRREAAGNIEKAWWGLVLAQESSRVVIEGAASIRAHVAEAEDRLDRGIGLRTELLSAKMRVDDLEALLSDADSGLSLARARLNLLIGLPWDAPTEARPPTEPESPTAVPAIEGMVERARIARPELASAASRIASAEAAVRVARSGLLPSVFLTGSYSLADPNPKSIAPAAKFVSLWDIGLLVSMDLGRIPASLAQAEEARANAEQARLALAQAGDSVTLEVVSSWLELSKAAERLRASAGSVGLAEEALRSQKDRFAAGLALSSDVSDAEAALLRSRLDRTRSRVAWELARAALRDSIGED
jgi:outer membrane protein